MLSDTYSQHECISVPEADVLVHCGNATLSGSKRERKAFMKWLESQPHRHKVFVPGCNDKGFEFDSNRRQRLVEAKRIHILGPGTATIGGKTFLGLPWVTHLPGWQNNSTESEITESMLPWTDSKVDVLITHAPPRGIGDEVKFGWNVGVASYLAMSDILRPKVHASGHIRAGFGVRVPRFGGPTYINCAMLDQNFALTRKPVVVTITPSGTVLCEGERELGANNVH